MMLGVAAVAGGCGSLWLNEEGGWARATGVCALGGCDLEVLRAAGQVASLTGGGPGLERMLLRLDAASPYAWMEMATADAKVGEYCVGRAEQLGPLVGPLQLRVLNFHMGVNHKEAILRTGAKLLAISRSYDPYVFQYYREAGASFDEVRRGGIPEDASAAAAWLADVTGQGREAAAAVWAWMEGQGLVSSEAAVSFSGAQLRWGYPNEASRNWQRYVGVAERREAGNLIFNPKFERPFLPGPFDWRVSVCPGVTTGFEEGGVLRVEFLGEQNVSYRHVTQLVAAGGGRWQLKARAKAEGLTTNQGPFLEVRDAEAPQRFLFEGEQLIGTTEWREWSFDLEVPAAARLLEVSVARRVSAKLDNKIEGVFRVSGLRLEARD